MKNEHLKSHFVFHLPKKRAEADPKKSALAQIFNRLRLQPKNLGFGRLRLCNTGFCLKDSTWAPYELAKTVLGTFSFSQRYSIA